MRAFLAIALLSGFTLAGCFGSTDSPDPVVEDDFVPRVVVAILDTGLNPYHDEFRQNRTEEAGGRAHPSTYLTGYPASAPAINVTFDLPNATTGNREYRVSYYYEHDSEAWNATQQEELYWIPGTKIIGLIGFEADVPGAGHGSMTTSRAAGNSISIPGAEVLVVHVVAPLSLSLSVGDDAQSRATRWMADQPFIDIQSHSWGMPFTCAGVATQHAWGWAEAFKYARDKQLVMVATANGHGNTGTLGYPSQCQDNSGIAGVVSVGGTDNAGYPTWANWFPAVAADGCRNPAIVESTINQTANTGGGTSSATPFSAGGAAKIVLEARRILRDPRVGVVDGVVAEAQPGAVLPASGPLADGIFTLDELKDVLFHTAISPPREDASDGDACTTNQVPFGPETPATAIFPFVGYGEVNGDAIVHAVEVLQGISNPLERLEEDQLYAQDQAARRAFWG